MATERTRTTAQAQAEGLRVFIAGVPWKIGEDTLRRDFEECGVVEDLFLLRDTEGNSTGKCFITFRDQDGVRAAMKYDSTDYGGRTIYVKLAAAKQKSTSTSAEQGESKPKAKAPKPADGFAKTFPAEKPEGCRSLCLKNIGDASEDDLRKLLKDCPIQSIRMVVDRVTNDPRGIAFVDFKDTSDVDKAIAHNGEELKGRAVEMHYEKPRERPRPEGCLTVAVKKLHAQTKEGDILKLFKGLESITEVRVILDKEKLCTGLAFAEFSDPKDVEAAVLRDGMKLRGQVVFICYETKEKKSGGTGDRRKIAAQKRVLQKKGKKATGGGQEGELREDGGEEGEEDEAAAGGRKAEKRRDKRRAKRQAAKAEVSPAAEVEEATAEETGKAAKKKTRKRDKEAKKARKAEAKAGLGKEEAGAQAAKSPEASGVKKKIKSVKQKEEVPAEEEAAKPKAKQRKVDLEDTVA